MARAPRLLPVVLAAAALASAGLATSGCTRGWRDTPYGTPYPTASAPTRFQGDPTQARQVTVVPGDTVYAISRRLGVPTRAIIVANDLAPPFILQPGQVLSLPPQRVHVVAPGETLYALSRLYGPPVSAIANANGLAPPYVIRVGESLVVPLDHPETPAAAAPTVIARTPLGAPPPQSTAPASPTTTVPADPVPLLDPTPGRSASPTPAPSPTPTPPPTASPAAEPPPPPPMPSAAVARDAVPGNAPPPRAGSLFHWPVEGTVITEFGPNDTGQHNDGLNIAVPEGTPIRAADNGVVVYAGNELQGFGNLILIRHAENWTTAYGQASRLDVRRGQVVERGQVIARSGRTGNVDRPQIHFEIRQGTRPVDPRDHLVPPGTS
ncbi:LysM peptidoglycan-binding domain-containing M23 family metallopeptidase [Roseospira marina]|uniref:LysM peptidoglycan-binding domain-containing M23 family metallopeptidase n=1 Tax=Roseospira marina TaxID=140057 RepID=A0A5M6IFH4_9PROT|nr:LysM peptidoglycan-binding domain-containing M23 family metallopeptidase [Roseospira marina]KAA5606882.1 LysM peptidoglycan-binding domain-containing M23 family metallopeptidase [Roseospira marina]MBB4312949.1 murein DD-endopeptidase MepM/ murein hydrolase activator NlpD [Roseospira marina]MBB5086278.1 murein DD-endopeptidase MepM/ murein hydrolase activator NlpD [Roseospira marina]